MTSDLLVIEGRRAAARYGERATRRARAGLAAVTLLALDEAVLDCYDDRLGEAARSMGIDVRAPA